MAHHIKLPPRTLSWVLGFLRATDGKSMSEMKRTSHGILQKECPPLPALSPIPSAWKPLNNYNRRPNDRTSKMVFSTGCGHWRGSLTSEMCQLIFGAGELCTRYPNSSIFWGRRMTDLIHSLDLRKNLQLLIPYEISCLQHFASFYRGSDTRQSHTQGAGVCELPSLGIA